MRNTLLYICGFVTSGILATNSFRSSSGEKIDEEIITALDQREVEWPTYTILCPLYEATSRVKIWLFQRSRWIKGYLQTYLVHMRPSRATSYSISAYLNQHYDGGYILQTNAPFHLSESEAGIHFSNVIYEGSGVLWRRAIQDPIHSVDWVIMQPGDRVAKAIAQNDPAFSSQFMLVASESSGLSLYHKNGLPPLPTRPLSSYLAGEQQFCTAEDSGHVVPTTAAAGSSLFWKARTE